MAGTSAVGGMIDVNGLVSQLMGAERVPLDNLKAKEASFNAKLSAFGTLKSAIATFQAAVKAVSASALGAQTATSSNPAIFGATAPSGSGATQGSYSIEVTQLAQRQKLASAAVASGTPFAAAGTMSITVGGKTTSIPNGDGSLQGLSNAINGANAGVSATIVNDGTADHLVITAKDSGAANTIKITANGSLAGFDTTSGGMAVQQAAQDAILKIDGMTVTKPSNTITDAIKGVTLNLTQTNIGNPATLTVGRDSSAVKKSITDLVAAYNTLGAAVGKLTTYDPATKKGAVLNGDAAANSIMNSLRQELGKAVGATDAGGLTRLSDIGVSFQRDGTLAVDDTKLQKALDGNFDNVTKLFSSASGFGTRLSKLTADMVGTTGAISNRTVGLKNTIDSIGKSEDAMEDRLVLTEARYKKQFTALDVSMSKMQNTSTYLTQQLAAIANNG
jgi:flagellar hook-associated protein 2